MWNKAKPYLPYIKDVFKRHGLPNELCLLPMIESSFNPKAANSRAAGLWQFIVPTAKEYGLRINFFSDQRHDWKKSTVAAAKYFSWLADRYDRDWALVLAAYNVGPGALSRSMKKQGTNSYWKLKLRTETMNYVPKFVGLVQAVREEVR
jgi:membrane-bound lytic murein transglycosylase D